MAQIVHDLAPGATLDFATAFSGELGFAAERSGRWPRRGAGVIVDDVSYFEEPFFQDGPVAAAVNEVTAAGVSYFAAAGNDNLIDKTGRDIASWEAPAFRDSTCPAALFGRCRGSAPVPAWTSIQVPAPTTPSGSPSPKGQTLTVDLQWAEPWNGVSDRPRRLPARRRRRSPESRRRRRLREPGTTSPASARSRFCSGKTKPAAPPKSSSRSTTAPGCPATRAPMAGPPGSSSLCSRTAPA